MLLNYFSLYITQNIVFILYFSIFIFFSSWLGIAFSDSFVEGLFFIEILYLSILIFGSIISIIVNNSLVDLFLIFILLFTVCDSILGLIFILVTFRTVKNVNITFYSNII